MRRQSYFAALAVVAMMASPAAAIEINTDKSSMYEAAAFLPDLTFHFRGYDPLLEMKVDIESIGLTDKAPRSVAAMMLSGKAVAYSSAANLSVAWVPASVVIASPARQASA